MLISYPKQTQHTVDMHKDFAKNPLKQTTNRYSKLKVSLMLIRIWLMLLFQATVNQYMHILAI